MTDFDDFAQRLLANPKVRAEYDASEEQFALARQFIAARTRADLTQAQLAQRMHTSQAVISRLESGTWLPSLRTLQRFAAATGSRLRVEILPAAGQANTVGADAAALSA